MFLIIRVIDADRSQGTDEPQYQAARKVPKSYSLGMSEVDNMLQEGGFELGPVVGVYNVKEWPLTVTTYTSMNEDGYGRVGSRVHTWPCRKLAQNSQDLS